MSKHTPGPWHVANGVQIRGQRDQIARVWMMRNGEGSANARLIAAAPEMLAALRLAQEWLQGSEPGRAQYLGEVIAKAEGKPT
jgi:hypothetical protein